jgi:hypothetical protein
MGEEPNKKNMCETKNTLNLYCTLMRLNAAKVVIVSGLKEQQKKIVSAISSF